MHKSVRTIDMIVRAILGFTGTLCEIPRLVIRYMLGLIWAVYLTIRGRGFKRAFSRLNKGLSDEIKWLVTEFKCYIP